MTNPPIATFDPALSSMRDKIRLLLGDTDTENALLQDATIDAALVDYSYRKAVILLAQSLIAIAGQQPSDYSESGGVTLRWADRVAGWRSVIELVRRGDIAALSDKIGEVAIGKTNVQQHGTNWPPNRFRSD